jgi:hypothetical protein
VGRSVATDLGERNPEPPTGGEAHTDLLCEVFFAPTTRPLPATDGGERGINAFTVFIYTIYFSIIIF